MEAAPGLSGIRSVDAEQRGRRLRRQVDRAHKVSRGPQGFRTAYALVQHEFIQMV